MARLACQHRRAPPRPRSALACTIALAFAVAGLLAFCGPAPAVGRIIVYQRGPVETYGGPLPQCPPPGFSSVPDLNLTAFVAAPWYVQMQVPTSYQGEDPRDFLYCVRATYVQLGADELPLGTDPRVITGTSEGDLGDDQDEEDQDQDQDQGQRDVPVFQVINYANRGRVNGPPVGTGLSTSSGRLLGAPLFPAQLVAVPDPEAADTPEANSQLLVGNPSSLPGLLNFGWRLGWGQYWVVAVLPSNNTELGYDWAIISGGAPEFASSRGCLTEPPPAPSPVGLSWASRFLGWVGWGSTMHASRLSSLTRGSSGGLWFFSRRPYDPNATREMLRTAQDLGQAQAAAQVAARAAAQERGQPQSQPQPAGPAPP
ncbi:hypothetical protein GPECTOR_4g724 [Gonium pectorale]|uniref:Uncharacterized protein n=1 Tax=Gonium pectorale TaxID=33097 RepID=A0A150GYA0_GONPE|nr:hypothetical protein GPECTOR_4g724 [Gonium pectorale]|eukprot:KXZ54658.1 hypothetical protein GPECTOR_4g724 [Gonium pectorale]